MIGALKRLRAALAPDAIRKALKEWKRLADAESVPASGDSGELEGQR